MKKQTLKEKREEEFIKENQGKYFCKCGCCQEIKIKYWHKPYSIPNYISGHYMKTKESRKVVSERIKKVWEEPGRKEVQSKRLKKMWKESGRKEKYGKQMSKFHNRPEIKGRFTEQSKEYSNRPEVKKKFKEFRKTQIFPTKDTSIEVKIQNFLKQLGIEYFTHQYMKIEHGYQCDILIPVMNLVIECDGDYWHKYPVGNDIDHIRTKELIEKGFKVLRLWEFEINAMSIKEFEGRIK